MRSDARPEEPGEATEELQRVREAMDRIDPAKRAILMLRAGEQLSYEEIATHLGVPVGTVMSRLNRARAALMEEMKRDNQNTGEGPMVFPLRHYMQG